MNDKERDERREAMIYDIVSHIKEPRAGGWKGVMARYPEVGERTFWRMVKKFKKGATPEEMLAGSIKKMNLRVKDDAARNGEVIPPAAPLPPVTFAPPQGTVKLIPKRDFLSRLAELIDDVARLKAYSESADGQIKNPNFFTRSIELRKELIMTELQANRDMFNYDRVQGVMRTIIEEVSRESPELGARIIERLRLQHTDLLETIGVQ